MKNILLTIALLVATITSIAQPTISSFSPTSGTVGTEVRIDGTNFDLFGTDIVYFGATKAMVIGAGSTYLLVIVPAGATYQPISVTNKTTGLTAYSSQPFTPTFNCGGVIDGTTFSAKTEFTTGFTPGFNTIAVSDLNNDGKPDIAITHYGNSVISIYKNTSTAGSVSFARAEYGTGTNPEAISIADVDGDGKPDVVTVNSGANTVSVLRNTSSSGNISFASKVDLSTGTFPKTVSIGDLDGDGKPELVVANNNSNTISVFQNIGSIGTISFSSKVDFTTGIKPYSVIMGDIDGDGKSDIAVSNNTSNSISVFQNTSTLGTISLAGKVDYSTGSGPRILSIGDIDGDGKSDLAVVNISSNSVSVFQNNSTVGSMSLTSKVDFTTGANPNGISIADVDGDGKPDLTIANCGTNTVSVLKNTSTFGTISLATKVDYISSSSWSQAVNDFDGDGKTDLAAINYNASALSVFRNVLNGPSMTSASTATLFNEATLNIALTSNMASTFEWSAVDNPNTTGESTTIQTSNTINNTLISNTIANQTVTYSVTPTSLTGCVGTAQTVTVTIVPSPPTISSFTPTSGIISSTVTISGSNFNPTASNNIVFFGATMATVTDATATTLTVTVPPGATNKAISVTDITKGLTAYSSRSFTPTFSCGGIVDANSFTTSVDYAVGTGPAQVAVADFDGDGKIDVIVPTGNSANVSLYKNASTGGTVSFATKVTLASGGVPKTITIADFDGDGRLDFAMTNYNSTTVSIYRNTSTVGTISFATKVDYTFGTNIAIGDLDGDGKPDIVGANSPAISLFRNTSTVGTISFAAKVDIIGSTPSYISIGDIDGDGKPDLAVLNYSNLATISVYRNTCTSGTMSFASNVEITAGYYPSSIEMGDVDGDGKPDIAFVISSSNIVNVLLNTSSVGSVTFAPKVSYATGASPYACLMGDIDGDGKPELAVTNNGVNTISIFKNSCSVGTVSFASKVDVTTGMGPYSCTLADLDGDGKQDLEVANYSANSISVLKNVVSSTFMTSTNATPLFSGNTLNIPLTSNVPSTITWIATDNPNTTGESTTLQTANTLNDAITIGNLQSQTVLYSVTPTATSNGCVGRAQTITVSVIFPPPTISSFSPMSGNVGSSVTITGTYFNTTASNNVVLFGTTLATVTDATATSLTVTVPAGAKYNAISVTDITTGLTATSSKLFTPTFNCGGVIDATSFATKVDNGTAAGPNCTAVGDLDGDGKPDLAVVNYGSGVNTVSIFKNTSSGGTISFATKVNYTTGTAPFNVSIGDIDGDGKLDLVTVNNSSNTISVFRNTSSVGTISFATKVDFTGSGTYMSIADIDGDGKLDVAVLTGTTIRLFRNTSTIGTVSFAPFITLTTGSTNIVFFTLADIDGNGSSDIVCSNGNENTVSIFRNTSTVGTLSFATKVDIATATTPSGISIGDLDGDGKSDIAVMATGYGNISLLRNTSSVGAISFATRVDLTPGTTNWNISIADVDGDGKPDLVYSAYSLTISVLKNNSSVGIFSFAPKFDFVNGSSAGAGIVSICDLDGDGKSDIIVPNYFLNNISIFKNLVNGIVLTSPNSASTYNGSSPNLALTSNVAATFNWNATDNPNTTGESTTVQNGSTINDVITGSPLPQSVVYSVTPTAVSGCVGKAQSVSISVIPPPPSISSFTPSSGNVGSTITISGAHFNTTAANNIVFFGATMATVSAATATSLTVTVPAGATFKSISVTDITTGLTGNSVQGFTPTYSCGGIINSTSFAPKSDYSTGSAPYSVASGDIDGDGKSDIVVVNYYSTSISIYKNTSTSGIVSFASKVDFTAESNPQSVSIADVNGDGKLDVIVANYYSTVSVFKNTSTVGSISLAARVNYATGVYNYGVSVADLDNDGKPELVSVNYGANSVSVLRNISTVSTISFSPKVDYIVASNPSSVAIADVDGDGMPDIASTNNNSNSVSILRNTSILGNISFATKVDVTTGSVPMSLSFGDFDGDAKNDIAVSNYSGNSISVLRNTSSVGAISFATKVDYSSGMAPYGISIGDVDGDGLLDIAVACRTSNAIYTYKNGSTTGILSFASAVSFGTGTTPMGLSMSDFDGDGKSDFVSTNYNSNSISVLRNTVFGGPIMTSPSSATIISGNTLNIPLTSTISSNYSWMAADNPNTTGESITPQTNPTITNTITSETSTAQNVYYIINPTATNGCIGLIQTTTVTVIQPPPTISSINPSSGAIGTTVTITGTNFNIAPSNTIVYFGATKATITAITSTLISVTVPEGATYQPISVNNVATGQTVYSTQPFMPTFSCGGTIDPFTLANKTDFTTGSSPWGVAMGDIDGDGKTDMVVANNGTNTVSVFRNISTSGTISYDSKVDFTVGSSPYGISLGDIDGDGKLDIAVANNGANTFSILRNTSSIGSLSFDPKVDYVTGFGPAGITIGDMDGDGLLDIATANINSSTVSTFKNTSFPGYISCNSKIDFATGSGPFKVIIGDIDGDGKPDLATANNNASSISILRNNSVLGSISFASNVEFGTGLSTFPRSIAIGDIDGDGKLDIATGNMYTASISVFRNTSSTGSVSFASKVELVAGSYPASVAIGDIDGDGKADISCINNSSATLSVFKNKSSIGTISFNSKVDFATGASPNCVVIGDIDGDGKSDIAVSSTNATSVSVFRNTILTLVPKMTSANALTICNAISVGLSLTSDITSTFEWSASDNVNTTGESTTIQTYSTIDDVLTISTDNETVNYTVIPTSMTGCVGNAQTVAVTVNNSLPSITTQPSTDNQTICQNATASPLSVSVSGVGISYQWYSNNIALNSGGTAISGATGDSYTPTSTDTYYYCEVTSGCSSSIISDVSGHFIISEIPNVTINVNATTICPGSETTLSGNGAASYDWDNGVIDGIPFTPTFDATYTVTGTNANGCTNTASTTITLGTPIVGAHATATTICVGDVVSLYGSGATSYVWDNSLDDGTPFINPVGTYIYTVTGTQGTCSNTASITIVVNDLPAVNAYASNTAVCAGTSVTVYGDGALSYDWDNGVSDNVPFNVLATQTYTVTGTDGNGCKNAASLIVTVLKPVIAISTDTIYHNFNACNATDSITIPITIQNTGDCDLIEHIEPRTPSDGLVAFYPFTGNANDASGNSYDGSVDGAILTTDRFGNANSAYEFDGSSNSLIINGLHVPSAATTINVWVQPMQTDGFIISKHNGCQDAEIILAVDNARYLAVWNIGETCFSISDETGMFIVDPAHPRFDMVTLSYDGSLVKLLVNNVEVATHAISGAIVQGGYPFTVGRYARTTTNFYTGKIDDIRIYNRALTSNEISQLYNPEIIQTSSNTVTIHPGDSKTIPVTLKSFGLIKGLYTDSLTIVSNDPIQTSKTVFCSISTKALPILSLNKSSIAFDSTMQWTSRKDSISIKNTGCEILSINAINQQTTRFFVNPSSKEIAPGDSASFAITFAPFVSGTIEDTLSILSNTATTKVPLSGIAFKPPVITLATDSMFHSFSACVTNDTVTIPFTIQNTGDYDLIEHIDSKIPTDGLVAYFPFDGNANDASGNGNNGIVNGATLTTDRFGNVGKAYSFDGSNYITLIPQYGFSQLSNPTDYYTISAWVKVAANEGGVIISDVSEDGWFQISISNTTGKFGFGNRTIDWNGTGIESAKSVQDNKWHLLTGTMNNSLMSIYIDGLFQGSTTTPSKLSSGSWSGGGVRIGVYYLPDGGYFKGIIDDITIYNKALQSSEINQLYNPEITIKVGSSVQVPITLTNRGLSAGLHKDSLTIVSNDPLHPTKKVICSINVLAANPTTGDTTAIACGSFTWNGITYNSSTTATKTLKSKVGCDSVVTLHLTIQQQPTSDSTATACQSFTWYGTTYTSSTTATHTFAKTVGCDSLVTLHLTINQPKTGDTTAVACESFTWYGQTYTASANPTKTLQSKVGCDSVVTLHLTINHPSTGDTTATACGSFTWYGIKYISSASPTKTLRTKAGCDSVVTLHLTINYPTTGDTTAIACGSFMWYGTAYSSSTTATKTLQTKTGCDSVVTLHLTIQQQPTGDSTATACGSFTWYGTTFTSSTTATHTFAKTVGCDSVVTLHLTINQPKTGDTTAVACESFTWYGQTYTASANPTKTLQSKVGCDSVVTLHLTINHPSTGDTTATACGSFTWYGIKYTSSASPTKTLKTKAGCDSVVTLHLTINYPTTGDTTAIACGSFMWYGTAYSSSTTATKTLQTKTGCDSVVTLHLTIQQQPKGDTTAVACGSFTWYEKTLTSSGTATHLFAKAIGCDSLVTLHLTINHPTTGDTTAVACGSFTWNGTNYTSSTTATKTLKSKVGCDSVVTLHLTINHPTTGDTTAVACGSFTWNGTTYNSSTTTTKTFKSKVGCDSVVTLHLTINKPSTGDTTVVACGSFTWFGTTYNTSATPTHTLKSKVGCDSVVTLHLTIKQQPKGDTTAVACGSFTWYGKTLTTSGTATHLFAKAIGCDSLVTLHLTINHPTTGDTTAVACGNYTWNGTNYISSTTATKTLKSKVGCDSVVTLHLTINNPTTGDTTAVACGSFTWNGTTYNSSTTTTKTLKSKAGCDSVVTLHLTINYPTTGDTTAIACGSFMWYGTAYSSSTTATKTLQTKTGCDSVVTLHLTIQQQPTGDTTAVACGSFMWYGKTFTSSGTATHLFPKSIGCDSLVTLHLTINHPTTGDTTAVACGSFTWNGTNYTSSTTATKTLKSKVGCDSVVTLHLTINHPTTGDTTAVACGSFTWNGTTYNSSTTTTKTLKSKAGCDSVVTLHLTINYPTTGDTTAIACGSFMWYGTAYSSSTTATKTLQTKTGCDSVVTLHLTIQQQPTGDTTAVACGSFTWYGKTLTSSGTATHLFPKSIGCDSLVTLHLTINHPTTGDTTAVACGSFTWNGMTYNSSTTATKTLKSKVGCDSVVTLHLTINHPTTGDTTAVACGSFMWNGTNYTSSTTATKTLKTKAGCDSIVTLHLTINKPSSGDTTAVACSSFTWYGQTFTQSGTQTKTFSTSVGCDSVVTLHLTINKPSSGDTTAVACSSFTWYGQTFTQSGTQTKTFSNSVGCDSVVTLHFTINKPSSGDTTAVACSNFTWYGQTFTQSGTQTKTFSNSVGCDSVVTLHLTINKPSSGDTTAVACSSFTWYGQTFTQSGTQTKTFSNSVGCDSVVTLHLTINKPSSGDTTAVACSSFTWYGQTFTQSGTLTKTFSNSVGCDSVVTLHLTINQPTTGDTTAVACSSFIWYGQTFTQSGTQTKTFSNSVGCDSVVTLHLTINKPSSGDTTAVACSSFTWYGQTFTQSGTQTKTFNNAVGCDSVVTLHLTINKPSSGDTTVVTCSSFTWYGTLFTQSGLPTHRFINSVGCDSVVTLHLTINPSSNDTIAKTSCQSYTWNAETYTKSGLWTQRFTSLGGCDSVVTINLTINPLPPTAVATSKTVCSADSIPALSAIGSRLYWYSDSSAKVFEAVGKSFETGKTKTGIYSYFVRNEDSITGCWSNLLASVRLTIKQTPTAPVVKSVSGCIGDTLSSITATGINVNWYIDQSLINLVYSGNTLKSKRKKVGEDLYYITQTDTNNCTSAISVGSATINPKPLLTLRNYQESIVRGDSILLEAFNADKYQWSPAIALHETNVASVMVSPTATMIYTVVGTNNEGCSSKDSVKVTVTADSSGITGFNELGINIIKVYPNPAASSFVVDFSIAKNERLTFEMYNELGQRVFNIEKWFHAGEHIEPFDVSQMAIGVYNLRMISKENDIIVNKRVELLR